MPDIYCPKCGILAGPPDLYCRWCGESLTNDSLPDIPALSTSSEPRRVGLVGSQEMSSRDTPKSWLPACLIVAIGLGLLSVLMVAVLFFSLGKQTGGKPAFAVEIIGTATLYPTRRPYATAIPYKISTPYPTAVPYPTTGVLATRAPTASASEWPKYNIPVVPFRSPFDGWCYLSVKNQNTDQDSVIILTTIDTDSIVKAVFVRASDSFRLSEISTGSYDIYVALGLDWDDLSGSFINNAEYFRFKDPWVVESCSSIVYGSQQYIEITLNVAEGSGSEAIPVPISSFPGYSP